MAKKTFIERWWWTWAVLAVADVIVGFMWLWSRMPGMAIFWWIVALIFASQAVRYWPPYNPSPKGKWQSGPPQRDW